MYTYTYIQIQVSVTIHYVCIGNRIFWTLQYATTDNYTKFMDLLAYISLYCSAQLFVAPPVVAW
jgi:spore coat protein U-like protein